VTGLEPYRPRPAAIRVLPTHYRNHHFRSRLEARWCVCFDRLELEWDYEPEGFRLKDGLRYLPDFWLPQVQMWAEVKPNDYRDRVNLSVDAIRKAAALAEGSRFPVLILDGPPRDTNYWAIWPDDTDPIGWDWHDVDLFDADAYHLTEHRFFSDTATTLYPDHCAEGELAPGRPTHPAIVAACSARFDRRGTPQ
jgi:hypothetical protein